MKCLHNVVCAAALAAAAGLLAGCFVASEHPLNLPDDETELPHALGSWVDAEGNQLHFRPYDQFATYNVIIDITSKNGDRSSLKARPTKIGESYFLDVSVAPLEDIEKNKTAPGPAHCFLRVQPAPTSLTFEIIDSKWLTSYLRAHPDALPHSMIGEKVEEQYPLLTASTQQLREFVAAHENAGLFATPVVYTQQSN